MEEQDNTKAVFEVFLTSEQQRVLNEMLPKGFSLQFSTKPNRRDQLHARPTKKVQLDGGSYSRFEPQQSSEYSPLKQTGKKKQNSASQQQSATSNQQQQQQQQQSAQDQQQHQDAQQQSQQQQQQTQQQQQNQQQQQQQQQSQSSSQPEQQVNSANGKNNMSSSAMAATGGLQKAEPQSPQIMLQSAFGGSFANSETLGNKQLMGGSVHASLVRQPSHNSLSQSAHGSKQEAGHGGAKQGKKAQKAAAKNKRTKEIRPHFDPESNLLPEEMKKCYQILQKLKKSTHAFPFMRPVDPIQQKCPDYFSIVKEPIDLSTVENNFRDGHYSTPSQFAADVRKIWANSYLYNQKNSHIYLLTKEMDQLFEKLFKEVEQPNFLGAHGNQSVRLLREQVERLTREIKQINQQKKTTTKGKKQQQEVEVTQPPTPRQQQSKFDIPMTLIEKRQLGQNIRSLPPEHLRGVWEIVSDGNTGQHTQEELEFDIDTLPVRKTRQLEQFVKQKLMQIKKLKNSKKGSAGQPRFEKHASYMQEVPTPVHMMTPTHNGPKLMHQSGSYLHQNGAGYGNGGAPQLAAKVDLYAAQQNIVQTQVSNQGGAQTVAVSQSVQVAHSAAAVKQQETDESDNSSFISDSE